jgi:ankyrin repeat protein
VVQVLLAAGANLEAVNAHGSTALHIAARAGEFGVVRLLLAAGAELETANTNGNTPLLSAAKAGQHEMVELLLAAGAKLEAVNAHGSTALHRAAHAGMQKVVQLLLSAGAKHDAADAWGNTPLHRAAAGGAGVGQQEVVQLLLAAGAELEATNTDGATPLLSAVVAGRHEVMQLILAAGAKLEAADTDGDSALHIASAAGRQDALQLLLAAGAKLEATNLAYNTPLIMAAAAGQHEVVRVLLAAGANVDAAAQNGLTCRQTALYQAVSSCRLQVVQLLLRHGADPRRRPTGGCAMLAVAADHSDVGILQLLLEAWGQPEVPAGDLVRAVRRAFYSEHLAAFARLRKLYPAKLPQLFERPYVVMRHHISVSRAVTAVLSARASDVSSLGKQQAAVRQREEAVANEKAEVQRLVVQIACMAKSIQQPEGVGVGTCVTQEPHNKRQRLHDSASASASGRLRMAVFVSCISSPGVQGHLRVMRMLNCLAAAVFWTTTPALCRDSCLGGVLGAIQSWCVADNWCCS